MYTGKLLTIAVHELIDKSIETKISKGMPRADPGFFNRGGTK